MLAAPLEIRGVAAFVPSDSTGRRPRRRRRSKTNGGATPGAPVFQPRYLLTRTALDLDLPARNSGDCFGHRAWKTVLSRTLRVNVALHCPFDVFLPDLPNCPSIDRKSKTLSRAVSGHGAVRTRSLTRCPGLTVPSDSRRDTFTLTSSQASALL